MAKNKKEQIGQLYEKARFFIDGAIEMGDLTRDQARKDFGANIFNKESVVNDALREGVSISDAREAVQEIIDGAKEVYAEKEAQQKAKLAARKGAQDMRVGGMVKSTVDRRKSRG